MSDLLTHEEYSAIANSLNFPTNAFINGQFQSSKSGKTFETINPATGKGYRTTLLPAMQMMWIMLLSRQGRRSTKGTGPNFIQVKEKKPS